MAVSGFKIQYLLFPVFWWCPGITIQSELHCTKCYAITQHEILFLPLWTSLSTYTVQICSCLVLELDVVYLSGLIADHVHIQIRSSLLTHYGMMQDKQPSAAGGVSVPLTLLVMVLTANTHIFLQTAFYQQLASLCKQHNSYALSILTPSNMSQMNP